MNKELLEKIPLAKRQALLEQARAFVATARRVIQAITKSGFDVQVKADSSLVTSADLEVERELRQQIAQQYPDHGVLGEEFPEENPGADFQWVLDPIDGTEAFAHGIPTYGCVVSLFYKQQPLIGVLDHPALDLCTYGGFGLGVHCNGSPLVELESSTTKASEMLRLVTSKRKNFGRFGEDDRVFERLTKAFPNNLIFDSCYAYTALVHGAVDAVVDYNIRIWDIGAVLALVPELGGRTEILADCDRGEGIRTLSVILGTQPAVELVIEQIQAQL